MTEAAIIGAGPIGIAVAVALQREGIEALHIDAGAIGSTLGWWAPGTRFFSSPERIAICGVPLVTPTQDKATREEYLQYLRGVAAQFGLKIRTFERVEEIRPVAGGFALRTTAGEHAARRVVAAIGDMHRPRMLNIPGEDLPHVSHYFQDPHRYAGRRVLIVGGKNSAVEAAIRLQRVGASAAISYRQAAFDDKRIKYWLMPELAGLIKSGRVAFHASTVPVRIAAGSVRLAPASGDGPETDVGADDVLLLTGYEMDSSLLTGAGVELTGEQRGPVFNNKTMETNVPGLYVAGTATAGTQKRFRVFIENCHVHADRIVAHILGRTPPEPAPAPALPPET